MDIQADDHPIEPDDPWPRSPTNVPIRCNVCLEVRSFEDRHALHLDEYGPGPHCRNCGKRIEFRCTVCDEQWRPVP
ncbi:hypothetical protein NI17_013335 [Thermobifida halotolerans]|uniref:Uncharacterized protein n=1 Tax=Thermobifida halotolerans TaxID=483545 RepID=A0A399FZ96_9ACTN|nr:hypothetical protein [Thermobifida halotolerans]UOE17865.1 hypothetical protein NI17_013335 [Thermobifida halotolerans]